MIFVTIGSMFPFDRMIRAMDAWAAARGGRARRSSPRSAPAPSSRGTWPGCAGSSGPDYAAAIAGARLVVAHAGVGSVVSAGEQGKPIVVLPRRAALGEHTSDHQVETVGWLRGKPGIHVADTEAELPARIAAAAAAAAAGDRMAPTADPAFIARIRRFIAG